MAKMIRANRDQRKQMELTKRRNELKKRMMSPGGASSYAKKIEARGRTFGQDSIPEERPAMPLAVTWQERPVRTPAMEPYQPPRRSIYSYSY